MGRFFIVYDSRSDPETRFIVAEFNRGWDAREFTRNVGGTVCRSADEGLDELLEAWRRGDDSMAANVWAKERIASVSTGVVDLLSEFTEPVFNPEVMERYGDERKHRRSRTTGLPCRRSEPLRRGRDAAVRI